MTDSIATLPKGQIEFLTFHKPALRDGIYRLKIKQNISAINEAKIPEEIYEATTNFAVTGARFSLEPQEIEVVFPPEGSLGDHANVLPHLVFTRSTLPWERLSDNNDSDTDTPWIALLLFDEDETPVTKSLTLSDLSTAENSDIDFPPFNSADDLEPGQHIDDKINVIDITTKQVKKLLPTASDLSLMSHVRQGFDVNTENPEQLIPGPERGVLFCNRLPAIQGVNSIHLVSVEGRYKDNDFQYNKDAKYVRFVSLKNWRFACVDHTKNFKQLLERLNKERDGGANNLSMPTTVRLPASRDAEAENYLSQGLIPLRHEMRQGDYSVSWYRGPLAPGADANKSGFEGIDLPTRTADSLLRYNSLTGMFDVSYAAAWELGRLLTLQNKKIASELFTWKRKHVQQLARTEQHILHGNRPGNGPGAPPAMPKSVQNWFDDLRLLKGIPFSYLVPDERMLASETIKFFQIDNKWLECLLDGAFSIGRVTNIDHLRDGDHKQSNVADKIYSGVIIRSELISGWPDLVVDAYPKQINNRDFVPQQSAALKRLRMDRLSPNVLFCLFEDASNVIQTVDIHQRPETLHFGLDRAVSGTKRFIKHLRNNRAEHEHKTLDPVSIGKKTRIVDIADLAANMGEDVDAAQFALEMIEGVQKVRFVIESETAI